MLASFSDPAFGFAQNLELTLSQTQYLLPYLLGVLVAPLFGIHGSIVFLCALYLGGALLGMRSLLRTLGKDERLALFVFPFLINRWFLLGVLPFCLGIAAMLWALSLAIRYFERPSLRLGVLAGAMAAATFFCHIMPFGILGVGCALFFPYARPRRWLKAALPFLPVIALLILWSTMTSAGQVTATSLFTAGAGGSLFSMKLPEFHRWLTDNFRDDSDDLILILLAALALLGAGLSAGKNEGAPSSMRRWVFLPLCCLFFYLTMVESHQFIFGISLRFPLLFLMTAIPLLSFPGSSRLVSISFTGLLVALAIGTTVNTALHFVRFEREEVADFQAALDAMAPSRRVVGLIFDRESKVVSGYPFMNFVSYYQSQKGGIVQGSFAGMKHWPFRVRAEERPPSASPTAGGWWRRPHTRAVQDELFPYFDYVLTRGRGFHPPKDRFESVYQSAIWGVFRRVGGEAAPAEDEAICRAPPCPGE